MTDEDEKYIRQIADNAEQANLAISCIRVGLASDDQHDVKTAKLALRTLRTLHEMN